MSTNLYRALKEVYADDHVLIRHDFPGHQECQHVEFVWNNVHPEAHARLVELGFNPPPIDWPYWYDKLELDLERTRHQLWVRDNMCWTDRLAFLFRRVIK